MIIHLAFFKFRPDLPDEALERLRRGFGELQSSIPEIRRFRWVRNNSSEGLDKGFVHGILMEFDSVEARQRYLDHPSHRAFARDVVIPALEEGLNSVIVFDYAN